MKRATNIHEVFNTNFNFCGKMDKLYNMNITELILNA
jgi:hypothetical protein